MLNRIIFIYSFSIAMIITVSVFVGYMANYADGVYRLVMFGAFAAFIWWIIPAPKWMYPFLQAMQNAKYRGTITKEELHAAIKAGVAEIVGK